MNILVGTCFQSNRMFGTKYLKKIACQKPSSTKKKKKKKKNRAENNRIKLCRNRNISK